ncbi:DNA-directed RNA polymerase I subunit RPA43 [Podospora aff. communis PSN243]|uniref:DNA-directed RNA polymerase subunit n=1 Tax=Podospora aff. communis PSN243 TaxID=3040156 RepID=A0AAV9GH68_9PEZI|nr:DNA-directed RNA polymerase I subunit RPA43 [Podospora aff. communis PSN243]
MSRAAIDSLGNVIPDSQATEREHKRDKSEHKKKKKRTRDEDESAVVEETPRKSKKTKSDKTDPNLAIEQPQLAEPEKKKKKKQRDHANDDETSGELKKKSKKAKAEAEAPQEEQDGQPVEGSSKKSKKDKKHREQEEPADGMEIDTPVKESADKREKRKEKKSKKHRSDDTPVQEEQADAAADGATEKKKKRKSKEKQARAVSPEASGGEAMEIDLPTRTKQDADQFPFYTQSLSLYIPLYPVGFDKPLTNAAAQHLDPLLNHYSPMLKGVLLSYSNLNLSERPVKASASNPSTDDTPALLQSVDEYAVGFGRLTFDAQVFIPARGKTMEGVVQLQNEGHIGMVCWGKFNASIEANRLPQGWKWVDLASGDGNGSSSLPSPEWDFGAIDKQGAETGPDGQDLQVVEQMHTTGYWVDERGRKVGGKLKFRIKNFDVGLAGDYGYLSIEGTFLDEEAERALAAEEREMEKRRKRNPNAPVRPLSRRVPEFSMTKLGREDEEEDSGQRTVVYKGSRPGTPDD